MQARTLDDPRPFRSLLSVGVAALLLLLVAAGAKGYQDLRIAQSRELDLKQRITQSQDRIDRLKRRVQALEKDPAALERLAREELWMARPDDVVIVLPDTSGPPKNYP